MENYITPSKKIVEQQPKPSSAFYKNKLIDYFNVNSTSRNSLDILLETPEFIVICNSHPISRVHLLLLPKSSFLDFKSVRNFQPLHLETLRYIHNAARRIVEIICECMASNHPFTNDRLIHSYRDDIQNKFESGNKWRQLELSSGFRIGYHAMPALEPLHLHILSDDFDSYWLKTKRQWNSFNSSFFLNCSDIEEWLQTGYCIDDILPEVTSNELDIYLQKPIKCHKCHSTHASVIDLKCHLLLHNQNR